jgi:hypothetical protein
MLRIIERFLYRRATSGSGDVLARFGDLATFLQANAALAKTIPLL